jgi:hypothetical protein
VATELALTTGNLEKTILISQTKSTNIKNFLKIDSELKYRIGSIYKISVKLVLNTNIYNVFMID